MNITIREAGESDYLAIGNLIKHELGYSNIDFTSLFDRLSKIESDDNHITYVAVDGTQVIGFIGLLKYITYELDNGYLRVLAMAVSQERQNMGIGSLLLRQAEKFATENSICHIMLTSHLRRLDAHIFYEHNGYIKKSYGFFKTLDE